VHFQDDLLTCCAVKEPLDPTPSGGRGTRWYRCSVLVQTTDSAVIE